MTSRSDGGRDRGATHGLSPELVLAQRALIVTLVVVAVLVGLFVAWQVGRTLLLIFLALIIAAAMATPADWIRRIGIPWALAIVVAYLLLLAAIVGAMVIIVPPLVQQAASFVDSLPDLARRASDAIDAVLAFIPAGWRSNLNASMSTLATQALPSGSALLSVPVTVLDVAIDLTFVLFLSAFMLVGRDAARRYGARFIAPDDRDVVLDLAHQSMGKLGAYVRGQVIIMAITGTAAWVGMELLGVPFALPMGLLAFLGEAIPIAGPFMFGVPIVLLAALVSPLTGLLMLGWILAIEQLESLVLVPIIHSKVVSVHPAVALPAVIMGGSLAGILGAIAAIPAVALADLTLSEVVLPLRRREYRAASLEPGRDVPGEDGDADDADARDDHADGADDGHDRGAAAVDGG